MDSLCFRTGLHGISPSISMSSSSGGAVAGRPAEVPAGAIAVGKGGGGGVKTAALRFSLKHPFRSLFPGAKQEMRIQKVALDDAVLVDGNGGGENEEGRDSAGKLEESEGQNGKWMLKILNVKSLWSEQGNVEEEFEKVKGENVSSSSCGDEVDGVCEACDCEYDDDGNDRVFDRNSFSKLLKRVSLSDSRLYAQMSYLGNLAYAIPSIKPRNLLKRYGLRYVTSSIEKREQLTSADNKEQLVDSNSQQSSNQPEEEKTGSLKAAKLENDKNEGPRIDPSVAFHIAASAASYLNARRRHMFRSRKSDIDQEILEDGKGDKEHISEMASSFMSNTDSVTAVVAAKEEVKQAVADDLNSVSSTPCEWYICDDDKSATRFFVIQGSETLASWQANLLFEPIHFEGFDIVVHRGIYETAKGMYQQMLPEIHAHMKAHGRHGRLRFSGHSLGGSLSLLINLMLLIRGQVPLSSLLPVITFGSPTIMCGGDELLMKLGLPRSHVQAVVMHRDIVPRAFSCNYPNHVAELLKAVNGNFRNHPCLNKQKLLYGPMGELIILQPGAILDVSPPPPKKRRKKFDMNGNRKFGGSGGRGAGDVELGKGGSASTPCSNSKSSEEGSAGWKSRLRSRAGTSSSRAKGKVSSPHGKRKLFKDLDEIEDEVNLVEDGLNDKEEGSDGGKSTIVKSKRVGRVRTSIDCEAEVQEVADNSGEKGSFEDIVEMSDEEGTLLTRLTSHMNDTHKVEQVDDGASHGVDKECEVASTCLKEKLIVHDDANEEEQVDNSASQVVEKDIGVGGDLEEENLIYNEDKNEEEQIDCSASKAVENESEVGNEEHLEEKLNVNDDVEASEQNVNASGPAECVKDALDEREITEVFILPNDPKDGEHIDGKSSSQTLQQEKLLKDKHVKQTGNSCTTYTPRHRKSRIKEGRRCGLCGGGTGGKPPKRLVPGTGGSDHEPYSGSSDSEEPEYDLLDGFGEEPGWLGRLLGPISDRYGIAGIWVHQQCAVWSPEVYFAGLGCLKNIRTALCRGKALKCTRCGRPGATTGCRVDRCPRTYHLPCARASRCIFDHRKFLIACTDHRHHFQPHGYHYLQRIKKLKAKKMKLEIRKQSNCAWRKDHEAEEKWLEKCGEDEEFLKRETKRLQRDMLRIAPVYVGGSHSEGENLFEGWDSVAGLQDVVRCMKEVVILPLLYPEFFDNMGLTPPRGVLLHGYPGTGKTLVVRSLIGSCARGEKRIAYFARKGADCLGKYVGDAERQLRLLFQVAEKCQPSIIFFDEIDGLAPVRSRQQDQTHSSVVSTLLALMDGLKSRGSVIVIGATNRPDAVDPALRRPGRFDREIYFPLPKVEDRASILALHTRKWPKPLGGSLLQWVAGQTVGFAGADLQALCTQSAMTALKRSCPLQQILLVAGERGFEGKCPQLPSVVVEERDWLEALSKAPPPCSRREAGAAANEIAGAPLHSYLVPCLLEPLSSMIVSLYLDQRIWLPPLLSKAGATIKSVIVSALQKKNLFAKDWWRHVQTMVKESEIAYKIVANFSNLGILLGDATCAINDTSKEVHDDVNARLGPDRHDRSFYGLGNLCYGSKEVGYRMLIAGIPKSGQRHLASCLLHCFVGNMEIHKIDMATISQEGHGDVLQGITQILMRCASLKSCVLFLPRIDLWAVETCYEVREESLSTTENLTSDSDQVDVKRGLPLLPTSDFEGITDTEVVQCASQTWNCFAQQVEALDVSSSLIIMATSDMPYPALPPRVQHFFESGKSTSDGLVSSQQAVPRIAIDLDGKVNHEMMMHSFAPELARDLVKQFIQLIYHNVHPHQDPHMLDKGQEENLKDMPLRKVNSSATEEPKTATGPPEDAAQKVAVPRNSRIMKGKSSLLMAITCFGYQILSYPHFAELCWVTSKLKDGPFADVRGPWKGWPFNSCVVRSGNTSEDTGACISSTTKVKEQFSLVRGLLAVGLSAYRGLYTSLSDVSLEVRKVLELLVSEISTRVQAGKDRYQYVRLLSQAAYLEDMVNNWVHSLRSLELDAQTEVTKPKLTGIGSAINNQDCPPDPSQVEANGLNTNLLEAETLHRSVDATTISISEPAALNNEALNIAGIDMEEAINILEAEPVQGVDGTSMNNAETAALNNDVRGVVCDDVQELLKTDERIVLPMKLKGSAPLCNNSMVECINREKDASRNAALAVDPVAVTDIQKSDGNQPSRTPSCENNGVLSDTFISNHQDEYTIDGSGLDSLKRFNGFADMKSHVSRDFGCTDHLRSSETYKQPETLSQVENGEADPCIGIDANYSPERRNHPSAKPEIMCSYSCCFGCANSLHQLIQKVVSKELELTGGCSTVEDVHDFVASLTSSLCLAVRKLHVAGSFAEPDNQVSSESCREVFQSEELGKCKCKMPEIREIMPRECTCHPGKSKSVEVDSSAYHQLTSRFIYKDGVLVPSHPGKDPPFHCKYENFCLCTLIELIVVSRQL